MELVAAAASYRIGEYAGMALLVVAIVYCLLRALWILPGGSRPAHSAAFVSLSGQTAAEFSRSVAPPASSPTPAVLTAKSMPTTRPPVRWSYVLAACVLAGLFALSVIRTSHASAVSPWDSGAGAQVKAGFITGCTHTGQSAARCGCLFSQLARQPAYSTPSGFVSLASNMRKFLETHDPRWLPEGFQEIAMACSGAA